MTEKKTLNSNKEKYNKTRNTNLINKKKIKK